MEIVFSNKKQKNNNINFDNSSIYDDKLLIMLEEYEHNITKMINIFNYNFNSSYGINCCYLEINKKVIHNELFIDIKLFLIGGECVLFGKLFNKNHKTFYTDFESIYNDCKYNHPEYPTYLINYNTCNITFEMDSIIITNTGYQGLGINLSNNLLLSKCHYIYIISCNKHSFQKDFKILSGNYKINNVMEIKTNYSVWIYKLKIHVTKEINN